MAKAKHKKHGKSAHAHADHGHADHGDDAHGHDAHGHDEPPPPPEPETPLWFSLLGGVLFIVFGLAFLVFGDDTPKPEGTNGKGESAEAAKRPTGAAAQVQADDAPKRPPAPPVRRLLPGDLDKKR